MIVLIAAGLIVWVVPQFAEIFSSFGKALPLPTQLLIVISNTLRSSACLFVLAGFIGTIFLIRLYGRTPSGRLTWTESSCGCRCSASCCARSRSAASPDPEHAHP